MRHPLSLNNLAVSVGRLYNGPPSPTTLAQASLLAAHTSSAMTAAGHAGYAGVETTRKAQGLSTAAAVSLESQLTRWVCACACQASVVRGGGA